MYSQGEEERYILQAFENREGCQRRLLDIGAYHPTCFSNTRALYELGWSGVMIEPSPGPMLALLEAYGTDERITLIQAAMAKLPGLVSLHVSDDAVSTSSETEFDRWKDAAKFRGSIMVPAITWGDIANQWGGFDFANIDAEGSSAELFLEMLELKLYPTCVCMEFDGRLQEILSAATAREYRAVLVNGTNCVVVRP